MKNRQVLFDYMALFGELFERKVSVALIEAYWVALENFDDHACENAFKHLIATSRFFPRPADILDLLTTKTADVAEVQAAMVLKSVKTFGAYQSLVFDDPVTAAVIQDSFGGWIKLCGELTEAKESWFIKDFVRAYQAFAKQGVFHNGPMAGIIERDNAANGFEDNLPKPQSAVSSSRKLELLN